MGKQVVVIQKGSGPKQPATQPAHVPPAMMPKPGK
jgi:hypothetical protein